MPPDGLDGLALLCDGNGAVVKCLRDDIGTGAADAVGHPFASLLDRSSLARAARMFDEVRTQAASFNHELLIRTDEDRVETLHTMAGLLDDGRTLLIGAVSPSGLTQFYDQLMQMNNEQINLVRSLWQESAGTDSSFEEFTRMNNELANAQRELTRTNASLGRAVADKNRLIGMASHDLRDPLGAIRSMCDMLLQEHIEISAERRTELVGRIRRSSEYMLSVIDEMLQWTSMEAGRLELAIEAVDVGELVQEAVAIQGLLAEGKGITIEAHVDPAVPLVPLDPHRFEQVLNNIVGNAVKFSPRDTRIDVRVTTRQGRLRVAVEDRGPGIPADEIDGLFQPFNRTSVAASGGEPSTGLGLAIASRIAQAHGGKIECRSQVGEGTTFTIVVPLERGA